jgi:competence protein ComEC
MGGKVRWPMQPLHALEAARGTLFPWVPVCIGCGIGLWFSLRWEPGLFFYAAVSAGGIVALVLGRRARDGVRPLMIGVACLLLGPLAAGLRVHLVQAPVLDFRYYGPIEGRVVEIDRSRSDDLRITLDRVVLDSVAPDRTPRRIRVSVHGAEVGFLPATGAILILTGHLTAPPGPSEPGGFDFRRMAFFDQLGAVGYSTTPVLLLAAPDRGALPIDRLRADLSAAITERLPGQTGAFASGAVTGDRSGINQPTVTALRDSNLSHLLAISGMNMAFISGFVFALVRYGLALVPPVALRTNSKKIAAGVALVAAAFYLALSGANVATERAFIMVAVMLTAVLADRRALSLRCVAIAGLVLLLLRPESLLSPGFQMSFAATTVLIAGFGMLDRAILEKGLPRWSRPVYTLVLSSALAGMATAPLAAAHFNRFTDYGLIANLLTVPAMGLLIMPGAVVAALLAPLGLEIVGIWMMGLGSAWILAIAHWVAGWKGSVVGVPMPDPWVVPAMTLGALWALLWPGKARWGGAVPVMAALAIWAAGTRPPLLISGNGAVVGLLGPDGRALSSPRGAGFAVRSWLENDGDLAGQEQAALRPGFEGEPGARRFMLGPLRGIHLKGKGAVAALDPACQQNDLVVVSLTPASRPSGCLVIDKAMLARTGTLAVEISPSGTPKLRPAEDGKRMWSRAALPAPRDGKSAGHDPAGADQ